LKKDRQRAVSHEIGKGFVGIGKTFVDGFKDVGKTIGNGFVDIGKAFIEPFHEPVKKK
jgi:hypothetical protein